jgi:hypothetical protein
MDSSAIRHTICAFGFVLAYLKADAHDIIFVLCRFWQNIDINRIPERDMDRFIKLSAAATLPSAAGIMEATQAWKAVKARYATL